MIKEIKKSTLLCFSLLIFFITILLQSTDEELYLFPRILAWIGLVLSVFLFVSEKINTEKYTGNGFLAFSVGGFLLIAMISAQWVGFFSMLFVISLSIYTYLQYCNGLSLIIGMKKSIITSFITCLILFLLFKVFLQIQVPKGILI